MSGAWRGGAIALLLFATPAPGAAVRAQTEAGPGAPTVEGAWARATPPMAQSAAAYLVIHGAGPDRLTGFDTPAASSATLHESRATDGVMRMRDVGTLPVQAGQDLSLAPGGYHVMLTGLKQKLLPGDHFPLTLHFSRAGAVIADVIVQPAGATGAAPGGGMSMPAHP